VNPAELFRQETDALKVAPGDVLFREGDRGDKLYVLHVMKTLANRLRHMNAVAASR
jgi:hypothetical protein